jgi:hypothetical protein
MESLVFNNRRIFEEVLDRSSVQEVEGDVVMTLLIKEHWKQQPRSSR